MISCTILLRSTRLKVSLHGADKRRKERLTRHVIFLLFFTGKCCIAGNSVFYDRYFANKFLPKFNSHLHYRIVDVSTIKELCR